MSNFSDLPNELIWHTATYLVTPFGQCCSDIAALALTNRRFHSVLNVLLYQVGADYVAPLFWAAQNGRADTLRNLLQTGLRDIGEEEWITEGAVFPTAYKVGRLAGRYRSLNVSSGVFNDDDQRIGMNAFASQLRVSVPYFDGDTCFFAEDGTVKTPDDRESSLLDNFHQRATESSLARDSRASSISFSPLHAAAANGHVKIIKMLLDGSPSGGSLIDAPSKGYCWCRRMPTLQDWHDMASIHETPENEWRPYDNLEGQDVPEWTALHHAICHGQVEAAKYLLERGASYFLCSQQEQENRDYVVTALHMAAGTGCLELVKFIVQGGYQVDIDTPDDLGQTSLHWACRNGHFDTVAPFLVAHGANINVIRGDTFQAANAPFDDEGQDQSLLFDLIEYRQYDEAARLFDLGANPNLRCGKYTALHYVCLDHGIWMDEDKDDEVLEPKIRLFIDRILAEGVDVFETASVETSLTLSELEPLEMACLYHNVQAVEALLSARSRLSVPDNFSCAMNCVEYCLEGLSDKPLSSGLRILFLLLDYASHVDRPPINKNTVLLFVLQEYLLQDPDSRYTVSEERLIDLAETLIRKGADPRFANESGETCFEIALRENQLQLCDLMLRKGFEARPEEIQAYWKIGREKGSASFLSFIIEMNKHAQLYGRLPLNAANLVKLLSPLREADLDEDIWTATRLEDLILSQSLLDLHDQPITDLNLALQYACYVGSPGIAEKLLNAGANANYIPLDPEPASNTLLIVMYTRDLNYGSSTRAAKLRLLDILLQNGADILQAGQLPEWLTGPSPAIPVFSAYCDKNAGTPLRYAVSNHDWEVLRLMFQYYPNILGKDSRVAQVDYLHLATTNLDSEQGVDRTVAELLRNGADPRWLDERCQPALHKLLCYVVPKKHAVQKSWVHVIPRIARMLWHDELDVNKTNGSMCLGEMMEELLNWQTKKFEGDPSDSQILYKSLANGIARHFILKCHEGGRFSIELRPLWRPFEKVKAGIQI